MKKTIFFLLPVLLISVTLFAQPGKVLEAKTISSPVLGRNVKYSVYLPPDYDRSERTYPVVYLLHGYTDDNTGWLQFGEINRLADKAIGEGTIPPMIIIMPDADTSWYVNNYDGKEKYEDFFIKEFIPAMEKEYHIKASKQYRGVAGLSMGGYGSMIYALHHPDMFTAAAPLSAGVFTDEELLAMPDDNYEQVLGPVFGRHLSGKARLNSSWKNNSVLELVDKTPAESLKKVRYWIDCGDDDFLTVGNASLHIALTKKKIPHEFRMRDGAHTWVYWRSGIVDALAFIGTSFRQ